MADDIDALADQTISTMRVDPADLDAELDELGARWTVAGGELKLEIRGKPMSQLSAVAVQAATIADEMDHHPRIVLDATGLQLTLQTRDEKAITVTDLVYAARLERWLRDNAW